MTGYQTAGAAAAVDGPPLDPQLSLLLRLRFTRGIVSTNERPALLTYHRLELLGR